MKRVGLELILCLAFVQTVSAGQFAKGDKVVTPHFKGVVDEVLNDDQVRVESLEAIPTVATYSATELKADDPVVRARLRREKVQGMTFDALGQKADWSQGLASRPSLVITIR